MICANCHAPNAPDAKFCSSCGTAIAPPKAGHCTQCGATASPGAKFCGNCGARSLDHESRLGGRRWPSVVPLGAACNGRARRGQPRGLIRPASSGGHSPAHFGRRRLGRRPDRAPRRAVIVYFFIRRSSRRPSAGTSRATQAMQAASAPAALAALGTALEGRSRRGARGGASGTLRRGRAERACRHRSRSARGIPDSNSETSCSAPR